MAKNVPMEVKVRYLDWFLASISLAMCVVVSWVVWAKILPWITIIIPYGLDFSTKVFWGFVVGVVYYFVGIILPFALLCVFLFFVIKSFTER